jgi:hypothetical protein
MPTFDVVFGAITGIVLCGIAAEKERSVTERKPAVAVVKLKKCFHPALLSVPLLMMPAGYLATISGAILTARAWNSRILSRRQMRHARLVWFGRT